jgi:glycosidase
VQWSGAAQAGFTSGNKAWMRVQEADAAAGWNAAAQLADPGSVRAMWKAALAARKKYNLHLANFNLLVPADERVFAYVRNPPHGASVLVVMNWSAELVEDVTLAPDAAAQAQAEESLEFKSAEPIASLHDLEKRATLVLGSHDDAQTHARWKGQTLSALRPYEGLWFELQ